MRDTLLRVFLFVNIKPFYSSSNNSLFLNTILSFKSKLSHMIHCTAFSDIHTYMVNLESYTNQMPIYDI